MAHSLATRVARASAAATLVFSLGLTPAHARMGAAGGASFARPAFGFGHPHFAAHGFNRFGPGRFGFHRFGPGRFGRFGFNRFNRFGFNRFNRFGGNQLFVGGWGWGCCGWGGVPVSTGASEPVVVGGAPVIIKISADPGPGVASAGSGGCVAHTLIYDGDGKYAGERQSSQC
jgi:hypothetical protein